MTTCASATIFRLSARDLACHRGERFVFSDVSFAVASGEGLLVTGRNGAGKSSLLRLLAGLLRPSAGEIVLQGGSTDTTLAEQCHFVGHADGLKASLTARENLAFWASFLGGDERTPDDALDAFALGPLAELPARMLSAGQKRRLGLSRLMVARRPIWLLDEPTHALDAGSLAALHRLIDGHLASGGVALIASHVALPVPRLRELALGGRT